MEKYSASQVSAISRLFSSAVIRDLARTGKSALFARLAREVHGNALTTPARRVHNFFDAAFDVLKRADCRDEYIYKAALTHNVLLGKHSLRTAVMMNEFRVENCKADVAILNGTSSVYEVKSERDSLARLEKQIEAYRRFFATVSVIAGERHLDAIEGLVPKDVGIMMLTSKNSIRKLREAKDRPERTSAITIFESIRMDEAKKILWLMDVEVPVVPNTEIHAALRELFIKLSPCKAHAAMVTVLKQTRNLLPLSDLVSNLPVSLQSAALSVPLRKADHNRLLTAMNTPLMTAMEWN